jgi:hypothetical protein
LYDAIYGRGAQCLCTPQADRDRTPGYHLASAQRLSVYFTPRAAGETEFSGVAATGKSMTVGRYTLDNLSKSRIRDLLTGATDFEAVFREIGDALAGYRRALEKIHSRDKNDLKRDKQHQLRELEHWEKILKEIAKGGDFDEVSLNRLWRNAGQRQNKGPQGHKNDLKEGRERWKNFLNDARNRKMDIRFCIERTREKMRKTGERERKTLTKSLMVIWQARSGLVSGKDRAKFERLLWVIADAFGQKSNGQLDPTELKKTWQNMERPKSEDSEASDDELLTWGR